MMAPGRRGVANARMYAINDVVAQHWRHLLGWVLHRAGVTGEVIDHPAPAPLPALWARDDLACVFMCGYPLAHATPPPIVLAAPVPAPEAFGHEAVYWTDIVVRADAPVRALADLRGRRFAFTTEDSQSGYHAPRRFFASDASRAQAAASFSAMVGPLVTPRNVVRAVLDGRVDAGPLDSYVHALLRRHEPDVAAQLRIIASTPATPIPPLIASPRLGEAPADALRTALLDAHRVPELQPTLAALLIERFQRVTAADYASLAAL